MPLSLRTSKITSMSSSMPPWMNTRPVSRRPSARCLDYPRLWLRSRPREESRVSCLFKRQCRIKEFGSFSSRELRRYHMSLTVNNLLRLC
uniref:Uncharacterized protein n=1 Tax=Brassica oleracea TaxID=3712 RepID=A0A3P6FDD8_BRAOL|nr:unnamed protein product [Brassica oleracea]